LSDDAPLVIASRWDRLRDFTAARIALGRAGISQPTTPQLAFQLAHAQARDAVHLAYDTEAVAGAVQALGLQTVVVDSRAPDRLTYLQRPDLGRRLTPAHADALDGLRAGRRFDLAFVVADGLSARAVHEHAPALIAETCRILDSGWSIAPVTLVKQGRVAVGDEVGERLGAGLVVIAIGERPGLSSPDSLGLYITHAPRVGLTDASRNCISNVRPAGLPVAAAAAKLVHLLNEARSRGLTGIGLKDETDDAGGVLVPGRGRFLLAG
jgi:ethanolamine ammonia-lyase small subunit